MVYEHIQEFIGVALGCHTTEIWEVGFLMILAPEIDLPYD